MFISRLIDVFLFADGAGLQSSDGAFGWNQQQATAYTSHGCVGVYVLARLGPSMRCCYMERVIMSEQKHSYGRCPAALMKTPTHTSAVQLCTLRWLLL